MRKLLKILVAIVFLVSTLIPSSMLAESKSAINKEIFYHILIDRYNNGDPSLSEEVDVNDELTYHGGDLVGITKKLDTLDQMGFTTIILSPVMENAKRGYHGYWIEDFFEVESQFGTMDELNHLIKEAHGRDIKVVLELVTNYVALSHPFVEDADKQDWFKENNVEPIEATEWLENVATLDQDNDEVAEYLKEVVDYWMNETDIDGFKFHAADQASEPFLEMITGHIKEENPQFYILAGTLQGDPVSENIKNIEHIDIIENVELFQMMNEVLTQPDQPITKLFEAWEKSSSDKDGLYVDNINTARFSNNFADNGRNSHTAWQLALAFLYTAPGAPIIYQGSEVPMYGPGYPENQYLVDFTVADQDLEKIFEKMSIIRESFDAFAYGDYEEIKTDEGMSVFKRTYEDETLYMAINNDSQSRNVTIEGLGSDLQLRGLIQDNTVRENKDKKSRIGIDRESVEIFVLEPNAGFNWWFIGFVITVFVIFIGGVIWLSRIQKKRKSE